MNKKALIVQALLRPIERSEQLLNMGNGDNLSLNSGSIKVSSLCSWSVCKPLMSIHFQFNTNDFGAIVMVPRSSSQSCKTEDDDIDLTCKDDIPSSPTRSRSTSPPVPKPLDTELLCCDGCGRYGMYGDFLDVKSCSSECQQRIKEKLKDKEKKERELLVQKQRREAKRRERERERMEKVSRCF